MDLEWKLGPPADLRPRSNRRASVPRAAQPLFHDAGVESAGDIYRHLAGHLAWKRLRELEATLARQGVRLALLEPEKLAANLIGLYDEVKQRQLL